MQPLSVLYQIFAEISSLTGEDRHMKQNIKAQVRSVADSIINQKIHVIRHQKVMLDSDLAELYGVPTHRLNEQVRRNTGRFPEDFMFRLTPEEARNLISQFAISSLAENKTLRFQSGTSGRGWGGRRNLPHAFTEQGVAMLSSVLKSERAIQVNIAIMRAFVNLRRLLATHKKLAFKLEEMERNYNEKFKIVFDVIMALMDDKKKEIRREGASEDGNVTKEARDFGFTGK
jgi:ORF6N domain